MAKAKEAFPPLLFFSFLPKLFEILQGQVFELLAVRGGGFLHVSETGNEALVGVFEGEFGLDTELAGHVHRGEKKVSEFVLEPLRIA